MEATFRLGDRPTKKGLRAIHLDISDKGRRKRKGIGCSILPELWDQQNQGPTKDKKLIQKYENQFRDQGKFGEYIDPNKELYRSFSGLQD